VNTPLRRWLERFVQTSIGVLVAVVTSQDDLFAVRVTGFQKSGDLSHQSTFIRCFPATA
ncbi:MAG: hypothetical protein ACI92S_004161, partial [Planctomycetaceae bacterium]